MSEAYRNSPFIRAVLNGDLETIFEMINAAEADRDPYVTQCCATTGVNALFQAAERKGPEGDAQGIEIIQRLTRGDNPLLRAKAPDRIGQTPLHYAARDGHVKCIEVLVRLGAPVNQQDHMRQTCIFYAAREGQLEALSLLHRLGAELSHPDIHGQTCLFYAAREGKLSTVEFLLNQGVSSSHKDKSKHTAIYFARLKNHSDIVNLLRWHPTGNAKRLEARAAEAAADFVRAKRPLENISGLAKKRYRLQFSPPNVAKFFSQPLTRPLPDMWKDADGEICEVFERLYPEMATWDPGAPCESYSSNDALQASWYAKAAEVLKDLRKLDTSHIFANPVDPVRHRCPDYFQKIRNPLSFGCIVRKLRSFVYETPRQFGADVALIFDNCIQYNGLTSPLGAIAGRMAAEAKTRLAKDDWLEWYSECELARVRARDHWLAQHRVPGAGPDSGAAEAKPEAAIAEAKPEAAIAEAKPEAAIAVAKPPAANAGTNAEAAPEATNAEATPEAANAEAKTKAANSDAKTEAATTETPLAAKREAPTDSCETIAVGAALRDMTISKGLQEAAAQMSAKPPSNNGISAIVSPSSVRGPNSIAPANQVDTWRI